MTMPGKQDIPSITPITEGATKTVLLVEDDVFLSNLLMMRLKKAGLNVVKAITGEEAIDILRSQKAPDLILLDIILPQKSGFEVLEEIKADPTLNKASVIVTSNLGQESDIKRGKGLGVIEYFVKAHTPIDQLIERIKDTLSKV